ncbi:hypothetical protein niasHT_014612 [Heterodera trifolii]|uniref:B30.2/SPRY domain-containing protein n=1 Tax=Heterodera trifolii TaxID=157864 RepID=A0ABD2LHV9_9BILA
MRTPRTRTLTPKRTPPPTTTTSAAASDAYAHAQAYTPTDDDDDRPRPPPRRTPPKRLTFGFAAKKWTKLEGTIVPNFGTYAYSNDGYITIDGKRIEPKEDSFKLNDIVGCGINPATRQIFFTKNGLRRGPFYLDANSPCSVPDELFPFVSLLRLGDKIEANFGPHFKFNLATL